MPTPRAEESVVDTLLIERYVDDVLANDPVVNNPLIPDRLERQLYILVVRIVLHLLQKGLGYADGANLLGRVLRVQQRASEVATLARHDGLALDPQLIESIARRAAQHAPRTVVSSAVDHAMHANTAHTARALAAAIVHSSHRH
jgi:hypothetical protein